VGPSPAFVRARIACHELAVRAPAQQRERNRQTTMMRAPQHLTPTMPMVGAPLAAGKPRWPDAGRIGAASSRRGSHLDPWRSADALPALLADYPSVAAYLDGLPAGLDSHPECVAHEAHEGARQHLLERIGGARLGEPFNSLFGAQWNETWMPDVHGLVAQMMLVDELGEPAYLQWIYADAHRVYDRPFLRHLMRLLSPSLIALGGASRWRAVHRGSTLTATGMHKGPHRMRGGVVLDYPQGLFPAAFCRALGETFRAAFDLAHAAGATVDLVEHGSERASFEIGWDR
jgi:hypothetical protein